LTASDRSLRTALPPPEEPRSYRSGDEEGAVAVLEEAFRGWPKVEISVPAVDHLRWKIDNHPQASELSLVTEAGGKIVAWQGYWMQPLLVEGEVLLAKQGVDFCVHPEYQGQRIRTKMSNFAERHPRRNFQMHFGPESGNPAMKRVVDQLAIGGRRLLANEVEALVLKSAPAGAALQGKTDHAFHDVPEFDDRIAAFWQEASRPFVFAVNRDQSYLNWRYADSRAGSFVITLAEDGGRILGYTVRRVSRSRGYIADLLALPERLDVARDLLRRATARLRESGVTDVECWLPRIHPYADIARECGFIHRRRTIPFVGRPSREHGSELTFRNDSQAAVHITIGDTDLV
jgi:GNAT superfamily N-acetyltransferase